MKKLLTLFIAFSLVSCNDGDFDVPEFEFEDTVYSCGENRLFYIASSADTETMIMTLLNGEIGTEVGTVPYSINSSSREVVYRLFNEGVTSDYFCQAIPPTTPDVVKELVAESGTITITTTEIIEEEVVTGYHYEIVIYDLLFVEDNGDQIYFETFEFGDEYEVDAED